MITTEETPNLINDPDANDEVIIPKDKRTVPPVTVTFSRKLNGQVLEDSRKPYFFDKYVGAAKFFSRLKVGKQEVDIATFDGMILFGKPENRIGFDNV